MMISCTRHTFPVQWVYLEIYQNLPAITCKRKQMGGRTLEQLWGTALEGVVLSRMLSITSQRDFPALVVVFSLARHDQTPGDESSLVHQSLLHGDQPRSTFLSMFPSGCSRRTGSPVLLLLLQKRHCIASKNNQPSNAESIGQALR